MFRIVTEQCLRRISFVRSSQLNFNHKPNFLNIASCNKLAILARNESTNTSDASTQTLTSSSSETLTTGVNETLTTTVDSPITPDALTFISVDQDTIGAVTNFVDQIPSPPAIPIDLVVNKVVELAANGEPTLASVGLGSYWPPGLVQQCLAYLHCDLGFPWWTAILCGTVVVRLCVFPLVIRSQRINAKMHNNMPQLQAIQAKMTDARNSGNAMMAAKYGQDMATFMKEKEIRPFAQMMVPLTMAPIFMSFFFGLRGMANLPLESLKTGGMSWFTDLTLADPYCILPLFTSCTLLLTIELGTDSTKLNSSPMGPMLKYVMRALPVIIFPFTMNFPAALLCYWCSTNTISLMQVAVLKIPSVREKFKIDPMMTHKKEDLPLKKKGFVKEAKDSWTNMKISRQMEERERHDEIVFKRAGIAPIPKTFKYDPTKVQPGDTGRQKV